MKAIYAVARREVIEKKFVFMAALAISVMPLLIPVLRGMTGGSGREVRVFLAVFAGWSFAAAVSAGLGAGLAGEIARGRGGFYFSRPLSSVSIWLGKLGGSMTIALAAALLVAAPTLILDRRLDPLADLAGSAGRGLLLAVVGVVLLFLISHAVATMLRSRSLLALADLLLAAAAGFLTWDALRRLYVLWPNPDDLLWRAGSAGAAIAGVVLIAAMHRGLERGRTDPAAAHRTLSFTLWSGLIVASLGLTAYSRWVLAAPASALGSVESATPFGPDGWIGLDGVARGARARFLYDTRTGRSQRVFGLNAAVSVDGSTAAWAQRESRTAPWVVRTMRLDSPAAVRETKLMVKDPRRMFLSADGSRLGTIEEGLLTVSELASGRSIGSVRIGRPSTFAEGVFVHDDLVRIYEIPSEHEGPLDILEFNLAQRTLFHTGKADSPRAWFWGSPLHDRFVDMDGERRVLTLRDGRTGAVLATLREGGPLSSASAKALVDGRWALLLADESASWIEVFSPAGERVSRIPIGPKGFLRAGGEVAPGKLAVALALNLYVADLDHGTATRSADGLRPISFWSNELIRPGSEATKLYLSGSRTLVRFDPITGDRKILLGSPIPD